MNEFSRQLKIQFNKQLLNQFSSEIWKLADQFVDEFLHIRLLKVSHE